MARKNPSTIAVAGSAALAPFTLIVDTREQLPYTFDGLAPVVRRALAAGDYSIVGHELPTPGDGFVIERKSIDDLFKTITGDRARFVRELEKLRLYSYAAILVEATVRDVLTFTSPGAVNLSDRERASRPRTVLNSLNTWQIEYGVRVLFVDRDRDLCRAQVFRLAERFWRLKHEKREQSTNAKNEAPAA